MKHLQGLSILVTQTAPSGQHLCQEIEAQGARSLWLPSIVIGQPPDTKALTEGAKNLHNQDMLIFLSAHAVAALAPFWPFSCHTIPARLNASWHSDNHENQAKSSKLPKIIAIGSATRNALQALDANMEVLTPLMSNSEGVLAMPELQTVSNLKIILIKGVGGRDLLEKQLIERGAKISVLTAYQRIKPVIDLDQYQSLMQNNGIDAMVCGSFESIKNLTELFKAFASFRKIPLIVVSERVRKLAQTLGFQTVWVAADASHEALVSILLQKREMIWRKKSLHHPKM